MSTRIENHRPFDLVVVLCIIQGTLLKIGAMKQRTVCLITAVLLIGSGCYGEEVAELETLVTSNTSGEAAQTPQSDPIQPVLQQLTDGVTEVDVSPGERDPFERPFPPASITETDTPPVPGPTPNPEQLPLLARYPVESLELVALMTRNADPIAVFLTPASSRAQFAHVGDHIGPYGSGRIVDIRPNEVIIEYHTEEPTVIALRDPQPDLDGVLDIH